MTAPADPTRAPALRGTLTADVDAADGADLSALEGMARVLTSSGQYKVLRQFRPRDRYHAAAEGQALYTALFVDVEATGLDTAADAIIEFAAVPFTYCPESGRIHDVLPPFVQLEDPGRDIPPEVQELTGITPDMVAGRRIDDDAVARLVKGAALVVAHNAGYDRPMLERRFPAFRRRAWACSLADVPWSKLGCRGAKLDYLLFQRCAEFFAGHRAEHDCLAAIHVLATAHEDGTIPFRCLLDAARRKTYRVWAHETPIEVKDTLKGRRYRWHPGSELRTKCWYRDCTEDELAAELAWLCEHGYRGRKTPAQVHEQFVQAFDARDRYSARMGS